MANCKDCLCGDVCSIAEVMGENFCCPDCKDRNRFVELPCKIGEELYRVKTVRGKKIVTETQLNKNTFWRIVFGGEYGKTVFLTREEAERALNSSAKSDS